MKFYRTHPLLKGLFISLLLSNQAAFAVEKDYIREYDYIATDYDSRFTSRINAIDGLKTLLLNELGTYVASVIEVRKDALGNAYMTQDTVQMTAGIIKLKLLDEKWNRISYYVKGNMRADEDDVLDAIKALRKDQQLESALRDSMEELKAAREAIVQLKQQLRQLQKGSTQGQKQQSLSKQYVEAAKNIEVEYVFQQALRARIDGDFKKSVKLFRKLADQDYAKAQSRLGHMYEKGMGVPQYYKQALYWGSSFAKTRLGQLYVEGDAVERDYDRALRLFQQAADKGSGKGLVWLGYMLESGRGVEEDVYKASEYYEASAEKGNPWAMARLGNLYLQGKGVLRDVDKAYSLILAGADRGNGFAIGRLGIFYEKGLVVAKNESKAFELYRESARLGSVFGQFKLGHAYHRGIGTSKDKQQALQWYQQAADRGHRLAQKRLDRLN